MNDLTELITKMILCRPISADVQAVNKVTDIMKDFLESKGLICTIEDFNGRHVLYASTRPGKATDLMFNAHLDVVPADKEEQYTPVIRDGKLFARGGHDCLGNAAVIAQILCEAKDKYSVGAVFTTDEEIGGSTTKGMVERGYKATRAAFILDTGSYDIAYAQKGIIEARLIAEGKGGHASKPWAFDNPIEKLFKTYLKLAEEWKNPTQEDQWGDSLAPCIISGGSAPNQIPNTAEMTLNIRYIDDSHREQILKKLKDTGLKVDVFAESFPMVADVNNDVIRCMKKTVEHVCGRIPGTFRMNGATDARHLKKLNIPVVIMGTPGEGAHADIEWLSLDALPTTVKLFTEFMNDFLGK